MSITETKSLDAVMPDLTLLDRIVDQVEVVFHGKREVVRLSVAALLARGHILFEDVPGVGKTTLAHALARALGLTFRRVQFTSDLLPSDVLGVSLFNPKTSEFETRPGPIFTNILLSDEINRAPPRTQSGLLQAMQEGRVTIDDKTFELPSPFLVLATQNPLEHHGTYPLPESQLDRFLLRLTIGYPGEDAERRILMESSEFDRLLDQTDPHFQVGVSPRGAIALFRAARAFALVSGRTYLVPDDVLSLAVPCLAHRLLPMGVTAATAEAHFEAAALLEGIIAEIEVPV